jgi:hypothetical protein
MTKTDEKWLERIRLWKASGQTAEAFADGQPFKASTLKWRAAELRRAAEGGERYGKGHAVKGSIRLARVVSRACATAPTQGGGGVVVEVSGARISLSRGFDAELLTDVVRALVAVR